MSVKIVSGRRPLRRRRMPKALNAAALFEIDDVIDPADTRGLIAATLTAAASHAQPPGGQRFVDTW
jgi:acetyl-CoA carboxylase carboxyltransferase component